MYLSFSNTHLKHACGHWWPWVLVCAPRDAEPYIAALRGLPCPGCAARERTPETVREIVSERDEARRRRETGGWSHRAPERRRRDRVFCTS